MNVSGALSEGLEFVLHAQYHNNLGSAIKEDSTCGIIALLYQAVFTPNFWCISPTETMLMLNIVLLIEMDKHSQTEYMVYISCHFV